MVAGPGVVDLDLGTRYALMERNLYEPRVMSSALMRPEPVGSGIWLDT